VAYPAVEAVPEASAGEVQAPKGKYRLEASIWNRIVSKFNEPRRFVRHTKGDIVELESHDAERLLRHGLVTPLTEEQAASAAAQATSPMEKAQAIAAQVGQQPIIDNTTPPA
jgi:hypothetical protein